MIILYLILIALGGIAYRLGGASASDFPKLPKWLVKSYTRDIGVPILSAIAMAILGKWHWSIFICLPLMYASLTTYWKCLNKYFGDTTEDCHWYNYTAHGLMIGLSFIPYGIGTDNMDMVVCRALLMAVFMAVWSELCNDVDIEEGGRGAIIEGTLWML